jgi:hypothetical protein
LKYFGNYILYLQYGGTHYVAKGGIHSNGDQEKGEEKEKVIVLPEMGISQKWD